MEIIYRALADTLKEKSFSTKEECEEYERQNLPRMWTVCGAPTTNPAHGYFIEVKDNKTETQLRELYPNENWKGLGADGVGIYRWDNTFDRYENISFYNYEILKTFIENNRNNIIEWL